MTKYTEEEALCFELIADYIMECDQFIEWIKNTRHSTKNNCDPFSVYIKGLRMFFPTEILFDVDPCMYTKSITFRLHDENETTYIVDLDNKRLL